MNLSKCHWRLIRNKKLGRNSAELFDINRNNPQPSEA